MTYQYYKSCKINFYTKRIKSFEYFLWNDFETKNKSIIETNSWNLITRYALILYTIYGFVTSRCFELYVVSDKTQIANSPRFILVSLLSRVHCILINSLAFFNFSDKNHKLHHEIEIMNNRAKGYFTAALSLSRTIKNFFY